MVGTDEAGSLIRYEVSDRVAHLTLDSPANRNALSRRLVAELLAGIDRAGTDAGVLALVIRAAGPVFCSGADLQEAIGGSMREGAADLVELQRRIVACPKPVVARVHGAVRAGGVGVVAASDIALASTTATFALSEVRLGLAPAAISLTVLPRLTSRAASLSFLTGASFDGAAAAELGLVTTAVPADELDDELDRVLDDLRLGHPQGLREAKRLTTVDVLAGIDRDGDGMAELSQRLFGSPPAQEAMQAFLSRKS